MIKLFFNFTILGNSLLYETQHQHYDSKKYFQKYLLLTLLYNKKDHSGWNILF